MEIVRVLSVARKEDDILAIALAPSVANAPVVIERIVFVLFVRRDVTATGEIAVALSVARRAMFDESGLAGLGLELTFQSRAGFFQGFP